MFSSKKDDKNNGSVSIDPSGVNSIKKGTSITGEIVSDGDIRFEGKLKGNITTSGKLIIGKTGEIIGDIKCKNADIEGTIEGKIIVSELLSLKASANVTGDINTKKLAIEAGAILNGTCSMTAENRQTTETTMNDKREKQQIK